MAALSIDLGGTRIKLAMVERRELVASSVLKNHSAIEDLDAVREEAARLVRASGGLPIDCVGIAVPGVVRPDGAGMARATDKYAYLEEFDLRAWSRSVFGHDAVIENDARAALEGEVSAGCAVGHRDVVMVTLGTGIGTAAMMDGRPIRGQSGHAGILGGHQSVALDGPQCPCGNIGCGEAMASTWNVRRMVDSARSALGYGSQEPLALNDFAEIFAAARMDSGELVDAGLTSAGADAAARIRIARRVVDDACAVWGTVVASMVLAYDPELVVLSGGIMRSAGVIVPRIESHLDKHLWSSLPRPRIVVSRDPDHSVVLGLASLACGTMRAAADPALASPISTCGVRRIAQPLPINEVWQTDRTLPSDVTMDGASS